MRLETEDAGTEKCFAAFEKLDVSATFKNILML